VRVLAQHLNRRLFLNEAVQPDESLNPALLALLAASEEYPELDTSEYLERLEDLAGLARRRSRGGESARAEALCHTLFRSAGFTGAGAAYYDPRSVYLNDVLERRSGLPVALTIVTLDVAWRMGLPAEPVWLPGHTLVRIKPEGRELVLDPLSGGRLVDAEAMSSLVRRALSGKPAFGPGDIRPVPRRQLVTRLLHVLRSIAERRQDYGRLIAALDLLIMLEPNQPSLLQERGAAHLRVRSLAQAQADFGRAVGMLPSGPASDGARREIERLQRLWLN